MELDPNLLEEYRYLKRLKRAEIRHNEIIIQHSKDYVEPEKNKNQE